MYGTGSPTHHRHDVGQEPVTDISSTGKRLSMGGTPYYSKRNIEFTFSSPHFSDSLGVTLSPCGTHTPVISDSKPEHNDTPYVSAFLSRRDEEKKFQESTGLKQQEEGEQQDFSVTTIHEGSSEIVEFGSLSPISSTPGSSTSSLTLEAVIGTSTYYNRSSLLPALKRQKSGISSESVEPE